MTLKDIKALNENFIECFGVSGHLRQWRYLLAAFASNFLLVDFFASTKMPARKMLVHICQYVVASVLFCQYIIASGFFCQPYLPVYFASNFLLAAFLPTFCQLYLPVAAAAVAANWSISKDLCCAENILFQCY